VSFGSNAAALPFDVARAFSVVAVTVESSSGPTYLTISTAAGGLHYILADHPQLGDCLDALCEFQDESTYADPSWPIVEAIIDALTAAHRPQLPGLVPAQTDPNDGAALSAAVGRIVGILERLGPEEAKRALRELREEFHPAPVSLRTISERPYFEGLLDFFRAAAYTGRVPARTYEELVAIVESVGLTEAEILSELPEETWITPSPQNRQPGASRHKHAWTVFLNIVKRLSQVCGYGTSCPLLVDISAFPDAFGLSGLHYDHDDPSQKARRDFSARILRVRDMFLAIGCVKDEDSDKRAAKAVAELLKCTLVCASCHDQAEKSGGAAREKRRPQP
jgi:hypothetical protein